MQGGKQMTSVEKVKAEVKIRTAQQPNPPLPVFPLPLFRTPHPRTVHDLRSQGIESLSVDDVCRLMTELGVGYCADVLQRAKVDGEELMLTKRHEFVELLEKNHIRTPKAKKPGSKFSM